MLENGAVNNPTNIRSGFAACGIFPLDPQRVLSRLPPEVLRRSVQTEFDQMLLDELQKNRYGDQVKKTRAKKANRLPPGTSYTVGARGDHQEGEEDPLEGTVPYEFALYCKKNITINAEIQIRYRYFLHWT
jgi:hypothetical protein